jgi:2,3-bisphosphoglycerate-dependent phosphoglycerate mutase
MYTNEMPVCRKNGETIMRIFLIRHGRSEGNEDQDQYRLKGDPRIELTPEGWRQAVKAGQFLKQHFKTHPLQGQARLWASTHMRTKQTAAGVLEGLDGLIGRKDSRVSSLLVEQDFGLFSHIHDEAERQKAIKLFADFYEAIESQDKFYARPPMGESPADTRNRMRSFIDTLMRDRDKGIVDAVVVTHGVTMRAFAMAFMNIDPVYYEAFKNPENCSIFMIEGTGAKNYSLRQIYNGWTGQGVDIDWGKILHAYENELPPVPDAYRLQPPAP